MATITSANNTTALLLSNGDFDTVGGATSRRFNAVTATSLPTSTSANPSNDNSRDLIINSSGAGAVFDDIQVTLVRFRTNGVANGTEAAVFNNCSINLLGARAVSNNGSQILTRNPGILRFRDSNITISGGTNANVRYAWGLNSTTDVLEFTRCRLTNDSLSPLVLHFGGGVLSSGLALSGTEFVGVFAYEGPASSGFAGVTWPSEGSSFGVSGARTALFYPRTDNRPGILGGNTGYTGVGDTVANDNVARVEAGGANGLVWYHEGDDFAGMDDGTASFPIPSKLALFLVDCNLGTSHFILTNSNIGTPSATAPAEVRMLRTANINSVRANGDFVSDVNWVAGETNAASAANLRMIPKHASWVPGTSTADVVGVFPAAGTLTQLADGHNGLLVEMSRDAYTAAVGVGTAITTPGTLFVIGRSYSSLGEFVQQITNAEAFANSQGFASSAQIRAELGADTNLNGLSEAQSTTAIASGITDFGSSYALAKNLWVNDFSLDNPFTVSGSTLTSAGTVTLVTTGSTAITGDNISLRVPEATSTLSGGVFNGLTVTGAYTGAGIALDDITLTATTISGLGDASDCTITATDTLAFASGARTFSNSNITSAAAINLSSTYTYGGSTLTSTLTGATNFNSVPLNLSDVTLIGSNTPSIAAIDGSMAHISTNVVWDGVVNFGDTSTGVVHVFNNTVFMDSPTNTAGGGVDFQLGPGDTVADTFNNNGIPTGFNLIPTPGQLDIEVQPIDAPSTVAIFNHNSGTYTPVITPQSLDANESFAFTPTETTGDYRVLVVPQSTTNYPVIRDFNFDGVSDQTIAVTHIPIVNEVLSTINDDGTINTAATVPSAVSTASSLLQRPLGAETDLGTVSNGTALTAEGEYRFSLTSHTLSEGDFVTFSNLTGFIGSRTFEVVGISGLAINVRGIPSPLPTNGVDTASSVALTDGRLKFDTNGAIGGDSLTNLQTQTHLRGILADPDLATVLIANVGDIAHNAAATSSTRIDVVIANSKTSTIVNSDYIQLSSVTTSTIATQQMTGGSSSGEAIDGLALIDVDNTNAGGVTIITPLVQFNPNPAGITIPEVITGVNTSAVGERTAFLTDGRKVGPYWSPTDNTYTGN